MLFYILETTKYIIEGHHTMIIPGSQEEKEYLSKLLKKYQQREKDKT